ncbi:hypothetical protein LPKW2_14145 [Lactiplantibacillus pentosus]|nr:hypothetical protein LPKW2_14145 [Lactiplantibacillus pentosus]
MKQPENAIVVIGKRDYDAMQETMYLLSSEKRALRLSAAPHSSMIIVVDSIISSLKYHY